MEAQETGSTPHNMGKPRQGGSIAAMFVYVLTALDNVGFIANIVSLVLYFLGVMHFDLSGSANTLTNFMGATFLLTIVGGFISDTYVNRLNTVLIFGVSEIAGYILLTVQAHYASLRPDITCLTCKLKGRDARIFYLTLCLLALGFGGIRGSLPALGADQFDKNDPKERKQMASFFNWYLLSITLGATLGVTVVVWVSIERDWALGFLISMLLSIAGFVFVAFGKPFYRVRVPGDSPLTKVIQVFVVAIRNRKLPVPERSDELYEIDEGDDGIAQEKISRTEELRWLDKAAVLPQGTTPAPWKVCSVTQVEEIKILIQMLPILASTVLMNTCLAQLQTFSVQQGNIMDLHMGSFKVPAASIPVIPLVFMSILIPVYEFAFVPLVRRFTGHPAGITQLQRVGVGLVLSIISMAVAGFIEVMRKNAFNHHGKLINLFWLSFQYGIFGLADLFTFIGLMDFFYSEAPGSMRSLSTSFTWLSLSFGYFLSSIFVNIIEDITKKVTPSRKSWLHGLDLNQNHLELFYWFLAIISCINFVVYVLCAKWYKYRKNDYDVKGQTRIAIAISSPNEEVKAHSEGGKEILNKGKMETSVNEGQVSVEPSKDSMVIDDRQDVQGR